ncbi:branched-chain amino acid aminotransferase [Fibrisoma limi BUZ 3]|uniref:branched-chain-amino-acid transaminase n=1 Tax=Fibrisoma limi BUZ 3 TaxID=1185876 RepID=I2GLP5_9BACT|nr:aminotransferase class IV [Fibrisoma limi]CCH54821.1 branched-chain amino acid aminotransferase [Fibrisoma limi BUZ 3]
MYLVYNSDIINQQTFNLLPDNRAFQYGDGLFETIRYESGRLWFWTDHLDRLTKGMATLQLSVPAARLDQLHEQTLDLIARNGLNSQPARIKIQVWRRPGGLYTPTSNGSEWLITAQPGQPFAITGKSHIGIYDGVRLSKSVVSEFKTLNALPYVLAGLHRQAHKLDDVILLSTDGSAAECVASNLFWFRNGTLVTPSLQTGCVNGIARRQLLRAFPDAQEGLFPPPLTEPIDVLFAANVMGIQVFNGQFDSIQMAQIQRIFTD